MYEWACMDAGLFIYLMPQEKLLRLHKSSLYGIIVVPNCIWMYLIKCPLTVDRSRKTDLRAGCVGCRSRTPTNAVLWKLSAFRGFYLHFNPILISAWQNFHICFNPGQKRCTRDILCTIVSIFQPEKRTVLQLSARMVPALCFTLRSSLCVSMGLNDIISRPFQWGCFRGFDLRMIACWDYPLMAVCHPVGQDRLADWPLHRIDRWSQTQRLTSTVLGYINCTYCLLDILVPWLRSLWLHSDHGLRVYTVDPLTP